MSMEIKTYYLYEPSTAAAGAVAGLFAVGCLATIFLSIRHKSWIWFVMVAAIAMEASGYGARVKSAGDPTNQSLYVAQFCLVVLAPVLMAGVIYVVFGRIVFLVVPSQHRTTKFLWVPARWITPIFVGFDVVALLLQLIGAVMISGTSPTDKNAKDKLHRGRDIAMVGVTLQIIAFGLFSIIAARFHFTSRQFRKILEQKVQTAEGSKFVTMPGSTKKFNPNWRRMLYVVNISCLLIMVRSVYREIDFAEGKTGTTQKHEWYVYVFDAVPILFVVIIYLICPPGRFVHMGWRQPKEGRELASADSSSDAYAMGTRSNEV
ncbi:putative rta1 domain protein [Phaeoacremonium minimum UCRPA7]|uniref:Putative rta1 domain protein n=1 Tax=Phaeoacremonium minimum (strain UCR-PA7) TaxID=1286976 RepID=R8BYT9_PHAM7|nr:putative rta1 domain protein [Phaeoacremonium minimum UCRPA7]EOO04454.1 putative rta1 domain protein [Phaeoacremonium minimum UCRPA7]